jgi:hypothetical protein
MISVRSWTKELKEELYYTGLAFVWRKPKRRNLREITQLVKIDVMTLKDKIFNKTARENLINTTSRNKLLSG